MPKNSDAPRTASMNQLQKVDSIIEQALDLSPAERKELIETLLFFEMVTQPESDSTT